MGRSIFSFVVVGVLALGFGCGAGSPAETTSPTDAACASYGDRAYARFTDIPKLKNGEISIGGNRYFLPMSIELHQDKIGLWCKGHVDLCFRMSDQEGQLFEVCEATDTRTDDPLELHSPQVEGSSEDTKKLLLAVLANALEVRFSPEEIQQIRRGEHSCFECREKSLVHGSEEYEQMKEAQGICSDCDTAFLAYVEAVGLLARRIEGPSLYRL